jgi:peptidoglycan L-alanyl-D-glutamate endopeptidase CwlK
MAITDQIRDIKQLNPLCQVLLNLALDEIKSYGINPLVVETYRTQERQYMLYAQGRTTLGTKITWTLNSIHTKKNAVDVVPQRVVNGKMTAIWNKEDKETKKIIEVMCKYGFEAGANWTSNADSPHFQLDKVSIMGNTYHALNTNKYITIMIQKALNKKINAGLIEDGQWGTKTTAAVNVFRKKYLWIQNGKLGAIALKKLLS